MSDSADALVSLGLLMIFGILNPSYASPSEECYPVIAALEIDNTINTKNDVRLQMARMAQRIAMNLTSGSRTKFFLVGEGNIYLQTSDSLESNEVNADGRNIAASAIEEGIKKSFPTNMFKTKAEIVYILVSESTPVEIPTILLLKKSFFIVFGKSVPEYVRRIAIASSHIVLIKDDQDIVDAAELLRQQTCLDSKYLCDVNMYKENRKYSTCKSCFNVCARRQIEENGCKQCPHMRIKLDPQEVLISEDKNEEHSGKYVKDKKGSLLFAITVAMTTVVVLSLGVSLFVCYRNNIACFNYQPINRNNQTPEGMENIHLEDPVEREAGNFTPLLPVQSASTHELGSVMATELRYINIQQGPERFGIEETCL